MGDTNTGDDTKDNTGTDDAGADQDDTTTEDGADTSKNTDANDADESDDDSSDAGDDTDDAKDGDDDGKGNSSDTESTDTADDDTKDEDDGAEPEIRKPKAGASNAEWAAWRKQEKGKTDSKTAKKGKQGAAGEDTSASDDASSTDDPVAKEVAKQLAPFHAQAAEQEVNAEIAAFIASNPDFKSFEAKVKRFAMHPSRANVPIKSIFYEVAGDKLMAIGATRKAEADAKARKTRTGGGSNANTDGAGNKSYKDMPLEDFGKELDAVKAAPRSR